MKSEKYYYCKRWRKENPERVKKQKRLWRKKNLEKVRAAEKRWRKKDPDRAARRDRANRKQREQNPLYRLLQNLRNRVYQVLRGRAVKSATTLALIGGSITDLHKHIEKKWKPGMTWENYGPSWHVDHIKPCVKFDLTDPAQQRECFHYTNLQPLWALDNLRKGAK